MDNKQKLILEYVEVFNSFPVFIETGTFRGATFGLMQTHFEALYTIELDIELWETACEKFHQYKNMFLLQGDSGYVLRKILPNLHKPCVFWLDAHWCSNLKGGKDTPIVEELKAIFDLFEVADDSVILIDDARMFGSMYAYPSLRELEDCIRIYFPAWHFEVKNDIIRMHNKKFILKGSENGIERRTN